MAAGEIESLFMILDIAGRFFMGFVVVRAVVRVDELFGTAVALTVARTVFGMVDNAALLASRVCLFLGWSNIDVHFGALALCIFIVVFEGDLSSSSNPSLSFSDFSSLFVLEFSSSQSESSFRTFPEPSSLSSETQTASVMQALREPLKRVAGLFAGGSSCLFSFSDCSLIGGKRVTEGFVSSSLGRRSFPIIL